MLGRKPSSSLRKDIKEKSEKLHEGLKVPNISNKDLAKMINDLFIEEPSRLTIQKKSAQKLLLQITISNRGYLQALMNFIKDVYVEHFPSTLELDPSTKSNIWKSLNPDKQNLFRAYELFTHLYKDGGNELLFERLIRGYSKIYPDSSAETIEYLLEKTETYKSFDPQMLYENMTHSELKIGGENTH